VNEGHESCARVLVGWRTTEALSGQ
jgi:hypothetical protein